MACYFRFRHSHGGIGWGSAANLSAPYFASYSTDLPPVVRPPFKFLHADTLTGAKVRVSGAGGRYPSALCGRCVL